MTRPLADLRVLELATGIAGPYAGRLLAMLGATVVKVDPPGGDPVRRQALDEGPVRDPNPLDLHLNADKRRVAAGPLEPLLDWAQIVLESRVHNELRGGELDPERWAARPDGPVVITTSPWGFDAEDSGSPLDEILVQAVSGVMSTTGDPHGPPLRFPGFQAQYFAGAYAATSALAALRSGAAHVDVPWFACMASGVEGTWSNCLQTGRRPSPGGAHQLDIFPSGALPCADGFVVPGTIRPSDWVAQCRVYGRPDLVQDERFRSRRRRRKNWEELWAEIEPWYQERTRREIFDAALDEGWALGMILRASDALDDPHLATRKFWSELTLPTGKSVRVPGRPWRATELNAREPTLSEPGSDEAPRDGPVAPRERQPLQSLRVLELTQAWAGPFVGRLLGVLGADVIKIESPNRPDGWRGPSPFGAAAPDLGQDPKAMSVEIGPNFNSLNRNKRHCAIDLVDPAGRALFLRLVGEADVVVANMTAAVLPKLDLDYETLARANPRIILINMPALGASGPFRHAAGYGTIVEGMGGFASLFGPPDAGARISQTYFPDPVAGLHATLAVLTLLEQRERTGRGGEVDLSHQEILWLAQGEALVASALGQEVERVGNRMPGAMSSGVFATRDERWVAVASETPCDDLLARSREMDAEQLLAELRAQGVHAGEVLTYADAAERGPMTQAIEPVVHPVTGERPSLRVPLVVDGAALETRRPAPTFDQHTDEVLGEWLELADGEIEALRAGGSVGGAPNPEALREFYQKRSRE